MIIEGASKIRRALCDFYAAGRPQRVSSAELQTESCYTVEAQPLEGSAREFTARARESEVAEEKPKVTNEISDETGQHDARFLLWRRFCSDNGIPVETMPGDLSGDAKQKWEKLKANLLPKSMNK
jgi:hypothetical protein